MKSKRAWIAVLGLAVILIVIAWNHVPSQSSGQGDNDGPDPKPGPGSDFSSVDVPDPNFDNMTAYTVGVPEGWDFSGELAAGKDCHTPGRTLVYTLQSPDHQIVIQRLHEMNWAWGNGAANQSRLTCGSIDMTSAEDYLVNIVVPRLHGSAKILEVLPATPEGEQEIESERQRDQDRQTATAQMIGMPSAKALVDGARVHIAYEEDGNQYEELLMAVVHCAETAAGRNCTVGGGVTVVRVPAGNLRDLMGDPGFLQLVQDVRDNPDWQAKRTDVAMRAFLQQLQFLRKSEEVLDAASSDAQRQRMLNSDRAFQSMVANNNAFNASQEQRFQASQTNIKAKLDLMHNDALRTEDFALDQHTYTDSYNNRTITASNQFNQVWSAPDGSLAGTTGNADPNDYTAPGAQTYKPAERQY